MAIDYPGTLPIPDSYGGGIGVGLISSEGGGPELERRNTYNKRRTDFQMSWSMDNATYKTWLTWVQANAYDWFNMPVITDRTPTTTINSTQRTRFTSPVSYAKQGDNWLSVSVSAELIPGDA